MQYLKGFRHFIVLQINMLLRRSVYIALLFLFIVSCKNEGEQAGVNIRGYLPELAGRVIYLEELEVRSKKMIDSTTIGEEGIFKFNLRVPEAGFYILSTSEQNQLILQADKGETIEISTSNSDFSEGYTVSGSPGSELLYSFEKALKERKEQIDSLAEVYYAVRGTEDFLEKKAALDSTYEAIVKDHKKYVEAFIRSHPGSLAALIVLNRPLGSTPLIDEEDDFRLFHITDSALRANYPDNKHVEDHHRRTREIRLRIFDKAVAEEKVIPGKKAPDIVLSDTAGEPFSLKSYTGYPVVVCFWAGWNAQSRMDNRKLVKMYDNLREDGIKILGVSLDENEVVWKGAVKLDSLPWKQVNDPGGLDAEVKKDYNLPDELPFYYLLDRDLKIRYKNNDLDSLLIQLDKLFL